MTQKTIHLPDLGTPNPVDVIEITVKVGDTVKAGDAILTLEGDKASMEIPSPDSGVIESIAIKVGDKVTTGQAVIEMRVEAASATAAPESPSKPAPAEKAPAAAPEKKAAPAKREPEKISDAELTSVYAGPGVRRLARELGVDLTRVSASGDKGRVLKEDVHQFVKNALVNGGGASAAVAAFPVIDFTQFGEVEYQALSKIKKLTGTNLSRNWALIPQVTQFIDVDITELEDFRKSQQAHAEKQGVKLTMLAFLLKVVAAALKEFPQFNSSLDASGAQLILKKYINIGVAVDTKEGLVVPVLRQVDQKSLFQLAAELGEMSQKARDKKLTAGDMQGGCFTISSLGGIGGRAFTPIVNWPDVAILGVSKASTQPVYRHGQFMPRLMLPLSLSYDHRVIDGADGARFAVTLERLLSDVRQILL